GRATSCPAHPGARAPGEPEVEQLAPFLPRQEKEEGLESMFGKRSTAEAETIQRPPMPATPARGEVDQPPRVEPAPMKVAQAAPQPTKPTPRVQIDQRSEDYYQIKTLIFSALIDTIDLAQLAQLDPDSAREEIRDIVNEIISIKAVVMSIAEQEHLLQDICNDVLGYGPLEPLLARDDIADIMVNGA